jgi:hypothetical protein
MLYGKPDGSRQMNTTVGGIPYIPDIIMMVAGRVCRLVCHVLMGGGGGIIPDGVPYISSIIYGDIRSMPIQMPYVLCYNRPW